VALADFDVQALAVGEAPEETGETYEANARLKARSGRRLAPPDSWVLGEDAGIEVAALGWGPGPRSARWSSNPVEQLLAELEGAVDLRARYRCTIVAIGPDGRELVVTGALDGVITHEQRGAEGFGYDPIFVPEGESLTVAELGDGWKRAHSHRARAAAALTAALGAS
jgi:XTP/dITP diphosphohydrolase